MEVSCSEGICDMPMICSGVSCQGLPCIPGLREREYNQWGLGDTLIPVRPCASSELEDTESSTIGHMMMATAALVLVLTEL